MQQQLNPVQHWLQCQCVFACASFAFWRRLVDKIAGENVLWSAVEVYLLIFSFFEIDAILK
jgi:hypothetical protein